MLTSLGMTSSLSDQDLEHGCLYPSHWSGKAVVFLPSGGGEGEEDEDGDAQKHRRQFADEGQGGVEIGWSGFTYVSTAVTYAQHWSYKSYVCKTAAKRLTNA